VPVVLTALEGSITLAEAMEARGYGSGPRTHYSEQVWHRRDGVVAIVAPLAAAVFVVLRITRGIADWYPFPDLTWPPMELTGVICCLALSIPLLAWRR
jgi:energy-coupling factor transport system permease protein